MNTAASRWFLHRMERNVSILEERQDARGSLGFLLPTKDNRVHAEAHSMIRFRTRKACTRSFSSKTRIVSV